MAQAKDTRAERICRFGRKKRFEQRLIGWVDAVLEPHFAGQEVFAGKSEQALNAFANRKKWRRILESEA